MSYLIYLGCCLLGTVAAMAVFIPLGAKRREWIPPLGWWLCFTLGLVVGSYGMTHATAPSFATRVTAVGKIHKYIERSAGRNSYFEFSFMPDDGNTINMRSNISFPYWSDPSILDGRKFRLVYLQDSDRFMENEAIDLEIVSGRDAGFHYSLDARPVGIWLAIPIGAAFAIFGFAGLRYMKDDAVSAARMTTTPAERIAFEGE